MFLNSNAGLFSRKVAKLLVYAAKKIPQYTKLVEQYIAPTLKYSGKYIVITRMLRDK